MKDFIELKRMKTLSEYNREMKNPRVPTALRSLRAGVTCNDPLCSTEMLFADPSKVCASSPRKMQVHCPECGQIGYYIVERANRRRLKALVKNLFTIQKID